MRCDVGRRAQVLRGDGDQDDETRVVLIKPGDTLLIGNVGDLEPGVVQVASDALRAMGFDRNILFVGDIEIGRIAEEKPVTGLTEQFDSRIEG